MSREVEMTQLDLRYEGHRMRQASVESRLLSSIAQRGIEEPLEGVDMPAGSILLNGFKRYRCAKKLQIRIVPYVSLGSEEATGILCLLRTSNHKTLGILEQAGFVDELKNGRHLSVAEIASELSVSKSWVSMRLGIFSQMSEAVRRELFKGAFPVYSYMYVLRQHMRMNGVKGEQIEQFVLALSGKNLSVREIEQLSHGFFRGPDSFRQEILNGNLALPLERIKKAAADPDGCSDFERVMLNDLLITQKYMQRVMGKSLDPQLQNRAFHAQSHLLTGGILSRARAFFQTLRKLHDRNGQA
jgi:hypothetical protein